jgi:hypothetical protein
MGLANEQPSWRQLRALRALASGKTVDEVARELRHHVNTVSRWELKFPQHMRVLRMQHTAAQLLTLAADETAPAAVRLRAASQAMYL